MVKLPPYIESLRKLAKYFNVPIEYFTEDKEKGE